MLRKEDQSWKKRVYEAAADIIELGDPAVQVVIEQDNPWEEISNRNPTVDPVVDEFDKRAQFLRLLKECFSEDELLDLCIFVGKIKTVGVAREVLLECERKKRVWKLVEVVKNDRRDEPWPDISEKPEDRR